MNESLRSIAKEAYKNTDPLEKRRALYQFATPAYTVDETAESLLNLQGSEQILDVGCGTGAFVLRLGKNWPKLSVVGVDLSAAMFADAERCSQSIDTKVTFQTGDIAALPFPSRSFDRVTALHMLYHVPDIDAAVGELSRVVSASGLVLISANSIRSKPMLRTLLDSIKLLLEPSVLADTSDRFNIESGDEILGKYFKNVHLEKFDSKLVLPSIEPYLDYFESLKSLWIPTPSETNWQSAMLKAREFLSHNLVAGTLQDTSTFGIFILEGLREL